MKTDPLMIGATKRRLQKLEQAAKTQETAMTEEFMFAVFDAMKISYDDRQLVGAIHDRGEPLVAFGPEEEVALERFSAEFERASALVRSQREAVKPKRVGYR